MHIYIYIYIYIYICNKFSQLFSCVRSLEYFLSSEFEENTKNIVRVSY